MVTLTKINETKLFLSSFKTIEEYGSFTRTLKKIMIIFISKANTPGLRITLQYIRIYRPNEMPTQPQTGLYLITILFIHINIFDSS